MRIVLFFSTLLFILIACNNRDYSPKPRGYYRISLPKKETKLVIVKGCPYDFQIPTYSTLSDDQNTNAHTCWKNIDFPEFNARLHLSYFEINGTSTLDQLTEDARSFVFKHTSKATSIDQRKIDNPEQKVFGLEYLIDGNTASNYQFYVSDSSKHYLRGALYFNEKPNLDSIQPVLEFLKTDIAHIISSLRWK